MSVEGSIATEYELAYVIKIFQKSSTHPSKQIKVANFLSKIIGNSITCNEISENANWKEHISSKKLLELNCKTLLHKN